MTSRSWRSTAGRRAPGRTRARRTDPAVGGRWRELEDGRLLRGRDRPDGPEPRARARPRRAPAIARRRHDLAAGDNPGGVAQRVPPLRVRRRGQRDLGRRRKRLASCCARPTSPPAGIRSRVSRPECSRPLQAMPRAPWSSTWRTPTVEAAGRRSGPRPTSSTTSSTRRSSARRSRWCSVPRRPHGSPVATASTSRPTRHSPGAGLDGPSELSAVAVLAGGGAAIVTDQDGPWLTEPGHPAAYRAHGLPRGTRGNLTADPVDPTRAYVGRFTTADAGATWRADVDRRDQVARVARRLLVSTDSAVVSVALDGGDRRFVDRRGGRDRRPGRAARDPPRWWRAGGDDRRYQRRDPAGPRHRHGRPVPSQRRCHRRRRPYGRAHRLQRWSQRPRDLPVRRPAYQIRGGPDPTDLAVDARDGRPLVAATGDGGSSARSTPAGRSGRCPRRPLRARRGRPGAPRAMVRHLEPRAVPHDERRPHLEQRLARPPGGLVFDISASPGRLWATTRRFVSWRSMAGAR